MPIPSLTNTSLKKRAPAASGKGAPLPKTPRSPPPESAAKGGGHVHVSQTLNYSPRPTSSHSITGDAAARRSFLPQPGDLKYAPRRGPDAARAGNIAGPESLTPAQEEGLKAGRPRPRSMYQTSTARTDEGRETEGASAARNGRLTGVVERTAAAQSSGLSRTPSMRSLRKPVAPMPPPQSNTGRSAVAMPPPQSTTARSAGAMPPPQSTTRSHVRTQSTSTVAGTSAEARTQRERPKSLFMPRSASVKAPERSPVDVSSTGNTARLAALRRTASVRTKPETAGTTEPRSTTQRPGSISGVQASTTSSTRTREPSTEEPKKQARPGFSTFQQHFTPRKIGKALTSTFLHPPAPEVGANAISAETASVQAELLQLHLLHQASAPTTRQWELSAKRSLQRQFEEVTSLHNVLREEERQGQEQKNVRALRDWSMGSASCGFAEHIQILSGPLQELPLLVDSGGRFQRLMNDFQRWIAWVEDIWAARNGEGQNSNGLESAEALGDSWKAEHAALTRKLTSFSRDLSRLTQPAPGSSVAYIVTSCQQLVDGLLQELFTMQKIENDVVARERDWVEESLKAIARDVGVHLGVEEEGGEAWRS